MRTPLVWIVLAIASAGCAMPSPEPQTAAEGLPAPTRGVDWTPGNWWAYQATIGNTTLDLALILHASSAAGHQMGSNLSAGFFGLPWSGNLTPELNPVLGPEVWPLFEFPLADGKSWSYPLLGHTATTTVRAARIDVPGLGERDGFVLEASAYGRPFARYDYSPDVLWFAHLQLFDPANGRDVLSTHLTASGADWSQAYYVEEPVAVRDIAKPSLPGSVSVTIPAGALQLRANLFSRADAGLVTAQLRDEHGRALATADVAGRGARTDRATVPGGTERTWTLEHGGVASGEIHLEVTALSATGPLAAPRDDAPSIDLGSIIQSTRPAWPQDAQTTSTGPVALGS